MSKEIAPFPQRKQTIIINIYLFVKYRWVHFGAHYHYIRYEKGKQYCRCVRYRRVKIKQKW